MQIYIYIYTSDIQGFLCFRRVNKCFIYDFKNEIILNETYYVLYYRYINTVDMYILYIYKYYTYATFHVFLIYMLS